MSLLSWLKGIFAPKKSELDLAYEARDKVVRKVQECTKIRAGAGSNPLLEAHSSNLLKELMAEYQFLHHEIELLEAERSHDEKREMFYSQMGAGRWEEASEVFMQHKYPHEQYSSPRKTRRPS